MKCELGAHWREQVLQDDDVARLAWAHVSEPRDEKAAALIGELGHADALDHVVKHPTEFEGIMRRWEALDLPASLRRCENLAIRVVVPRDREWPGGLDDLDLKPHCLFVAGCGDLGQMCRQSVSLVGARAATAYGQRTAAQIACEAGEQGVATVSGGALGIDAAAHRGAMLEEAGTICVLAGGIDRVYPAAHAQMFEAIRAHGVLVSEMPIGADPMRQRFLHRNRLIAALSPGTIVVEAGLRSGSLSTARRAIELNRVVGAVPGPVTSASSAGCHELIREGGAVLVTGTSDVLELIGSYEPRVSSAEAAFPVIELPQDKVSYRARTVWDALPLRKGQDVDELARSCALAPGDVRAALGELDLAQLAAQEDGRWTKA